MKIRKNHTLITLILLVLFLTFFYLYGVSKTHTITLTDKGFSPQEITIRKGDTVVFKTDTKKDFWPASNSHPVHDIYPEFDAKKPINANDTWSFKFEKVGIWRFHDHLNEFATGVIKVIYKDSEELKIQAYQNCNDVQDNARNKCVEDIVYKILEKEDIYQALETVGELYKSGDTVIDCHGIMHEIGRKAFLKFKKGEDFGLSDKTSYCGYGFYHGFMEEMLHITGNVDEARKFCDYVDKMLSETTSDAGGACYHGIGHGVVEDEPPPNLWGDAQGVINQGLIFCNKVSNTEKRLFRCATGVYNAYEILATNELYGLSHDKRDFFAICRKQEDKYKEACFTQLVVPILWVIGTDYKKAPMYVDTILEDKYAIPTFMSIWIERSRTIPNDYKGVITDCRSINKRYYKACIESYGEGFLKYGPPREEYKKAVGFCSSSLLTNEEKKYCFDHVMLLFRLIYSAEKSNKICMTVAPEFRYNNCKFNYDID